MRTVNEVTGQDLKWYWDQAVYGTQVLDYEVLRADVRSSRLVRPGRDGEERRDHIRDASHLAPQGGLRLSGRGRQ